MTISTKELHNEVGRYYFDCTLKASEGRAQLNTPQDKSYYGVWVNARNLKITSYAEGDIFFTTATTQEEFKKELNRIIKFENRISDGKPSFIDCMDKKDIEEEFKKLGFSNYVI